MSVSSGIDKIRASKYFPYAIIVYLGYILVLFILAIPYIPEIVDLISKTEISAGETYVSPIIPIGMVVFIPLVIIYILVDYRAIVDQFKVMIIPFKELNRRILNFTILFLILQLGFNLVMMLFLGFLKPDILDFSTYTSESTLSVWLVGCVVSLVNIILNAFIGWKWTKSSIERPNLLHWFFGYIIYLLAIIIGVIFVESTNSPLKGFILWPFSGIVIIGALSYFIVVFGLFLVGLEIIVSPIATEQSDAWIGFVFMAGIMFMAASILLLFIYILTFYMGVLLAKWHVKRKLKTPR